jgi:actin-related protein
MVEANEQPAIVIDSGSYQIRAGFAELDAPTFVFRNVIARTSAS